MTGFLRPQTGGRKGIAQFVGGTTQTSVGSGSTLNCFQAATFNNSPSIVRVSDTAVTLRAGKTYKITAGFYATGLSGANTVVIWQLYNNTSAAYVGGKGIAIPTTFAANESQQSVSNAFITATVDTSISFKSPAGVGTTAIDFNYSFVTIEELEEFIPQATGSIAINGDLTVTGGIKLPGTAPAAGFVGERKRADTGGGLTPAASNVSQRVASLSLTTGVWEMTARVYTDIGAATCSRNICKISTTYATDTSGTPLDDNVAEGSFPLSGGYVVAIIESYEVNVTTSSQTFYLNSFIAYAGTPISVRGVLRARRIA
jgi:hypothetical protein